uniref:GGDEF domain-containing protein n=1 Tax=candidate division WOR-3 bacterium TaxID=2052148 RepID=A0A7C4U6T0_UNCW3
MQKDDILRNIGNHLSSIYLLKDQYEIMKEILIMLSKITDCDYLSIFLLKNNPRKDLYEFFPLENRFQVRKSDINLHSEIITEVLTKKTHLLLKEKDKIKLKEGAGNASEILIIPGSLLQDVQGLIFVEKGLFSQEEISILSSLSSIIAFIILNSRHYKNLSDLVTQLRISYEISSSLIQEMNPDRLIERIFKEIRTHFGYDIIGVFILKDDGTLSLEYTVEENSIFKGFKLGLGEGIIGYVARTGESYYAPDVRKDKYYIEGVKGILSEFAIPLKIKDKVIGVLDINSRKEDDFPDSTRKLLSSLAALITISFENARLFEETKRLSKIDMLTGVLNRRTIEIEIERWIKRAKEEKKGLTIFFLDLDHFKEFNDRFGHQKGDEALKIFSDNLKKTIKEGVCGRYGGDEFICLFYDTEKEEILRIGNELIKRIEKNKKLKGITLSIGISSFPEDGKTMDELIRVADKRCYDAKRFGGNRLRE